MKTIQVTDANVIEQIRGSIPVATIEKNGLMSASDKGLRKAMGGFRITVGRVNKSKGGYLSVLCAASVRTHTSALMFFTLAYSDTTSIRVAVKILNEPKPTFIDSSFHVYTVDDGDYISLIVQRGGITFNFIQLTGSNAEFTASALSELPENAVEVEIQRT